MRHLFTALLVSFLACPLREALAEDAAQPARSVTVITSTDNSGYNLASALQYALAQLYRELGGTNVQVSAFALPGFTAADTAASHQTLSSEVVTFAYMDRERVSIFFFDQKFPGKYIVASNPILESAGQTFDTALLESRLRKTFTDMLALYQSSRFNDLPGATATAEGGTDSNLGEMDVAQRKAAEAGHLFRELAALSERPFYLGAHMGLSRYSNAGSSEALVNFGAIVGYRIQPPISVELGMNIFNYALLSLDAKYQIPITGKYVYLNASLGGGIILFQTSLNSGFNNNGTPLTPGTPVFGPGISFDIPLLGANLRGDLHYYIGSVNILLSSYGVTYSVAL